MCLGQVGTDGVADTLMVPPAATELWGIYGSQTAYLGAKEDLTTVSIYADDGRCYRYRA
uniref:Uncharacterized protein n=1 Tax=Candidatus Kentrum sp. LFY TaxID=2126342 RepID=A0A450ULW6_9GAMM|nr:MAG: hypothetical protein BECKLFY1418B_GA0070995_10479 [Candidatus Kentron sp. LFY]